MPERNDDRSFLDGLNERQSDLFSGFALGMVALLFVFMICVEWIQKRGVYNEPGYAVGGLAVAVLLGGMSISCLASWWWDDKRPRWIVWVGRVCFGIVGTYAAVMVTMGLVLEGPRMAAEAGWGGTALVLAILWGLGAIFVFLSALADEKARASWGDFAFPMVLALGWPVFLMLKAPLAIVPIAVLVGFVRSGEWLAQPYGVAGAFGGLVGLVLAVVVLYRWIERKYG